MIRRPLGEGIPWKGKIVPMHRLSKSKRIWARRKQVKFAGKSLGRAGVVESLECRRLFSVDMLQYHNDSSGTGRNLSETILNQSNVDSSTFGKLFTRNVDGQVYAQPIYKSQVNITTGPFQGVHAVVFVATENDSLYAIDAVNGNVLWQDSFLGAGITPVPSSDVGSTDLSPQIGITSTPVIDPNTNILYLSAKTEETRNDGLHFVQRLHAINISDGSEALGGPAVIADTLVQNPADESDISNYAFISGPSVLGDGDGAVNVGGVNRIFFNAQTQMNRPAVSLINGVIYLAFASHGDNGFYNGWILGYSAANLSLVAVFNATPNGSQGGIWQSGAAITSDASGNLYVSTGNGTFDTTMDANGFPINHDYGDSILKLAVDPNSNPNNQNGNGWGLKVVDYFTPYNQLFLDQNDVDLSDDGILLLPNNVGSQAHQQLLAAAGKQGVLYLIDRNNMGHFNTDPNATSDPNIVQEITLPDQSFGSLAYFGGTIYIAVQNASSEAFSIANAQINTNPVLTPDVFAFPGGPASISADGTDPTTAVAWEIDVNGGNNGQFRAYAANDLADELYNSDQAPNGRDTLGPAVKFSVPTVLNGMAYVGTSGALVAYGLLPLQLNAPTSIAAAAQGPNDVHVTWTPDPSTNASGFEIDRSLNNANNFAMIATVPAGTTTFEDLSALDGETYYYRVESVSGTALSPASGNFHASTPLLAPTNLTPALSFANAVLQIALSWNENSAGNTSQEIDRSSDNGNSWQTLTTSAGPTATSYADPTVAVQNTYIYRIRAIGATSNSAFDFTSGITINFATLVGNVLTIAGTPGDDTITLTSSGGFITAHLNNMSSQPFEVDHVNSIVVLGLAGNDSITNNITDPTAPSALIFGGPGNDTIIGGPFGDTLIGGAGNDSIQGGVGNDSLYGGFGNDTLAGGPGNDTIVGGTGTSLLIGGAGNDSITGRGFNDTLWGGFGDDTLVGTAGPSIFYGKAGNDLIYAHNGFADTIYGGDGNDTAHIDQGLDQIPNNDVELILTS
jgi:Ca2+-binding RTX toxin-like protein